MKKAVIYYKDTYNIGDTVQTYAANSLIEGTDVFLDREALNTYNDQKVKLLCNGYFMAQPQNWPPSQQIDPLFISFHISGYYGAEKYMLNPALKSYYNNHGPIGCRDKDTAARLKSIGVDSYYSSCLTLTLDLKEKIKDSGEIIFADAFLKMNNEDYANQMIARMVPASLKSKIVRVKHDMDIQNLTVQERLPIAEALLKRYAAARLVITSRIHCALPCLAMGTPVYFMDLGYDRKNARKRFDGILDLMNTLDQKYFPFSSNQSYSKLLRSSGIYKFTGQKDLSKIIDWDHAGNKQEPVNYHRNFIKDKVKSFFA